MKVAVVVFPGSNCDADVLHAYRDVLGAEAEFVWYADPQLPADTRLAVLPGGFSYGDYLRSGAMAARAPIMAAVARHAEAGGLVLGICNGFQMLTEVGLLPGALTRNTGLTFVCREVHLRVENTDTPFTRRAKQGQVLRMPIAHHDGCYYADPETLASLLANQDVLLRYATPDGELEDTANPNGSLEAIAGIRNRAGNVFGLMPHPERAAEPELGSSDGLLLLGSLLDALEDDQR